MKSSKLLLSSLLLSSAIAAPQVTWAQLNAEELNNLDGMWEGQIYAYTKNVTTLNPMDLQDRPQDVRLLIRGNPITLMTKNSKGEWVSTRAGFFDQFRYERNAGTIVGSFLHTGRNPDQWVEHQSLYITRKDPTTVILYWIRAVNNVEVPLEKPDSKWGVVSVGELRRSP